MSADFCRRVVAWALEKVGRPYLWGGNGVVIWTPRGLENTFHHSQINEAYDCVGLVKAAVCVCGGPDFRASENAQTLFNKLPQPSELDDFSLRFYGDSKDHITHVAFDLGKGLRLEAAGGGREMKTLTDVLNKPDARVRVGFERRNDFIGYGSLAALEKIKK